MINLLGYIMGTIILLLFLIIMLENFWAKLICGLLGHKWSSPDKDMAYCERCRKEAKTEDY